MPFYLELGHLCSLKQKRQTHSWQPAYWCPSEGGHGVHRKSPLQPRGISGPHLSHVGRCESPHLLIWENAL